MTAFWEPGTQYNYGDVVQYEGAQYKIIQPHRSQGDWTPPVTPALWGRMQGGSCDPHPHNNDCGAERKQAYSPAYTTEPCQQPMQQRNDHDKRPEAPAMSMQAEEKPWYDVDDDTKKKLEIGGGIAAGAALLGGAFLAKKKYDEHQEEKSADKWSRDKWMADAQAQLRLIQSGQCHKPATWMLTTGRNIPRNAISGGEENGRAIYICRVYHEGGLMIGRAGHSCEKGALIGYRSKEIDVSEYEILVGDARAVKWVGVHGKLHPNQHNLVEGGREPSGSPQYIAQAPYHGAVYPAKACEDFGDGGCYVLHDGKEKQVKDYAVLCYA